MLALKTYQQRTLDKLSAYLERARLLGDPARPFAEMWEAKGYSSTFRPLAGLEGMPYVCLRLPTGGGKTLLSAHTVALAADTYLETEYPLVLWLVPTDAIRTQTLETLKNPRHPNREVLDERFGGRVRVFDITDFAQLLHQEIGEAACVFVATFGAFRVNSPDGRKVYAHNENLEPHFARVPAADWMDKKEDGQIKFSFANLLGHHRPLVIVDEAHNHKTKLSDEVLRRVQAAAVIEYTATPAVDSNVLYKVSASELKAEDMIKLPVRLFECNAWTDAVTAAIQTRARLEQLAGAEDEYIRPIVLFQAQDKNEEVNVGVLVKHLVEQESIPREAIAVATGSQRELEGVNLFDRTSPVRFVVTVEALKEGWDCSFAYVFCSAAKVRSGKDAEQLLGRVLRMPYAKRRRQEELNKAYAHIPVVNWMDGLGRIRDNLVSMGFEEQEAEQNIQVELPLDQDGKPLVVREDVVVYSAERPDTSVLNLALQGYTKVEEVPQGGYRVTFEVTSREDARELRDNVRRVFSSEAAQTALVRELVKTGTPYRPLSPSERGETITVPQLCLDFGDGELRAAEKEDFLPEGIDLLQFHVALEAFRINHQEHIYEIDVQGTKVEQKALTVQEILNLPVGVTHWNESNMVAWLDRRLQQPDIPYTQMVEFLRRHVRHLVEHRGVPLAELVRLRFLLEKTLREKIAKCREEAYRGGVQHVLFETPRVVRVAPDVSMFFREGLYPVNARYSGSFQFTNHFFSAIADMDSEEIDCAKAIDRHPKVKTWVRNLDSQPKAAFWLPVSKGRFYPDFVVELKDGRILVIEYKGAHLLADPDTQEKGNVGALWASRSAGKCLFLMAVKRDDAGRGVWDQLEAVLR